MLRGLSLLLMAALSVGCKGSDPDGDGLRVTPAIVDFGEVVVGLLARRTLTMENHTPDVVRVIEARPDDPLAKAVRLERLPAALIAGSSAEVEVVFAPDREGTFSGTMRISTDGDPPEHSVQINGVAVAPFLRAIPEQIDFGRVLIHQASVWTATITNDGSKVVTVNAITPDMFSDEFSVGGYAIERLEPGASFSVDIIFTPVAGGRSMGRIVIGDDSPRPVPLAIAVTGEGVDGEIQLDPYDLDFTGALAGEERVRDIEIRNIGTSTHTIAAISLTGPSAFSIAEQPELPASLPPGQERRIMVRFAPEMGGLYVGSLAISDGSRELGPVSLYAEVFDRPVSALVVRPRALDFGGVEIGSSGARELTIESAGFIEVHLTAPLEIDPPGAPFTLLRVPPVGTTLKGFDSHTIEVRYHPDDAAEHPAVLRIHSDAANRPTMEVPLFGRGETSGSPDADPRPTSLEFGRVPRDTEALRTILLFNGGTSPLLITGVEVEEDAQGRFLLDATPVAGSVAPGERRAIRVRYSDPLGLALPRTGTVAISTDDPDRPTLRVPLHAETTPPRLTDDLRIHTTALDLHLIAEGSLFDRPADCCWCNPNPSWGDVEESPFLDNDFTGGQTIRLTRAEGTYAVEVHSREPTAIVAEVTIEIDGAPPVVRTREVGPGQRWRVGSLAFAGSPTSGTFTTAALPLDSPMDGACY